MMPLKDADGIADNKDPDQTAPEGILPPSAKFVSKAME